MDVLPRITRQLVELFRGMSLAQRATFVAVPLLVFGGFAWLLVANRPDDFQAVSFGKAFASDELSAAERALNQAGLTNYRREGRKLLAPANQLDRYNAALVEFDAVPADLGTQMLKQFESLGPFTTDRQRQEMKEALLLQELRRMIEAVPDIEHARVAVANSGRRVSFGQKPRVTANVTVKPRAGRELSSRLVASLRQAVASMVPDLSPVDVTVFDVARGQAHTGEATGDASDSHLIQRVREFTRQYEQQIQKALAFIPQAVVAVHVDVDNLKSSVTRNERTRVRSESQPVANRPESRLPAVFEEERSPFEMEATSQTTAFRGVESAYHEAVPGQREPSDEPFELEPLSTRKWSDEIVPAGHADVRREVSEKQLLAAMPRAVQVSVSIPRDYYRDVAARRRSQGEQNEARLDLDAIEEDVIAKVERTVGRLIPAGSPHEAISVTSVDRLETETPEPTLTMNEQLLVVAQRHGGSVALSLLAVWALWMLTRLTARPTQTIEHSNSREPSATMTHFDSSNIAPVTMSPPEPVPLKAAPIKPKAPQPLLASSQLCDEIRSLAESDPATAAAVLGRWLAEANV